MSESTLKPFTGKLDDNLDNKQQSTLKPFTGALDGEEKGVKGHLQDTGASVMSGLAAVPDTLVGLADMYTEGRAGKAIDDNLGDYYKLGNAQNYWQDQKTDVAKQQQKQFHEADGIVNKTKVALENPSMIANAAVESLPSMFLGGMLGKASKIANPVVGAAVGEGAVMAGSQAEQIRQNSDDQMLNNGQEAAAALTGGLGALFGFAGGRIAQKLGIGDVDTMLVNGRVGPAQIASEIADTPAKSLPRRVIEGAISEGFLEELPQSVSEQIIQNLATDKHWSDGVEDAAVMGTLAGMAMGGVANIPSGHSSNNPENEATPEQSQASPVSPLPQLGGGSQSLDGEYIPRAEQPLQNAADGNRTNYEYTQFDTDASNRLENNGNNTGTGSAPVNPEPDSNGGSYFENQSPSERLGLNPDHGPMSSAAALAVDSGASPVAQLSFTPEQQDGNSPLSDAVPTNYQSLLDSQANQSQIDYLEQQFADAKSVPEKAEIRKQINEIKSNQPVQQEQVKPEFKADPKLAYGSLPWSNDIAGQALQQFQGDATSLEQANQSLTGKGAATDLIYYKNSPSFSHVEVVDAGDKSIVKLTNAKTGQVIEREYPQELSRFNDFLNGGQQNTTENVVQQPNQNESTETQYNKPIVGADGQNKWFGSQEKADAFIEKKGITNTHQVVQTETKRFEIQPISNKNQGDVITSINGGNQANNVTDQINQLEQQFTTAKSVPQKAKLRKQIDQLKTQQQTEAATQWQSMSPEQRQAVVQQIDVSQVPYAKRLHTAQWDNIGDSVKTRLIGAMNQSSPQQKIDTSANEAATSPLNETPAPSQAQIEAGNYKKGHIRLNGLDISIENPKGSTRSGNRPDGTQWEHTMSDHYGYIKRTKGADNEHIDTYIGSNPDSDQVFIVDQLDQETGNFDEHKVMLGFDSQEDATTAYQSNFDKGWKVGPIRTMNMEQFKNWLKNEDTSKPATESNPHSTQSTKTSDPFADNKIFTSDVVAKARERLKKKLGQLNSGIDPEVLIDGMTIAGAYIESGVRKFGDYAKAMVADFGEDIKPYLLSFWEGARNYPNLDTQGMTSVEQSKQEFDALNQTAKLSHDMKKVVGEQVSRPKNTKKPKVDNTNRQLVQDWGVLYIDGWATNAEHQGKIYSDYGVKDGVKAAFLKDTKQYLESVQKQLEQQGYRLHLDKKGKPQKISVNESGTATAGQVTLTMINDGGVSIYVSVSDSAMSSAHPQRIAILFRATTDLSNILGSGWNQWAATDLTTSELAQAIDREAQRVLKSSLPKLNQGQTDAGIVQTKDVSSNDTQPAPADATTGNRDSQSLDDGVAKTSGSSNRDRGVSGRTEVSGRTGTNSVQQRAEPSSGTPRDSGTVRTGRSTTVSERGQESLTVKNNKPTQKLKEVMERSKQYVHSVKQVMVDEHHFLNVGSSVLTGQPVYTLWNDQGNYFRADVDSIKPNATFSQAVIDQAKAVKQQTEQQDAELVKKYPDGVFSGTDAQVVSSEGIPKKATEYLDSLLKMLGMDTRVFLTTAQDMNSPAAQEKYHIYGGHRSILSTQVNAEESGATRLISINQSDFKDAYIVLNSGMSEETMIEVIAHELGHIIEKTLLKSASQETQNAIKADFQQWLSSVKGVSKREHLALMRNRHIAQMNMQDKASIMDTPNANLSPYWFSFSEWFADQVSRWTTTSEKPLSLVEKFFARVAKKLKQLVQIVKNTGDSYQPSVSVRDYLDGIARTDFLEEAYSQELTTERLEEADTLVHKLVDQPSQKNNTDPATAETSDKPVLDTDFDLQGEDIGKGGIRQKYKDNIATIKILKTLESENRVATPEERKQIAQYTGWGALKGVFDKDSKQWSKEYTELKSLLTDTEYTAARASVLNAHYTSKDVVNGIISIVERLGFKSGRVLEPSVGTGNFFGLMPAGVRKKSELHGVELDPITSQIVAALYPSAKIAKATGFQDFQVPAEYFDLVIGNPPFGNEPIVDNDRSPYSGSSIHNYFFAKSIDKLRPGGVLAMVVSHNFMDARSNNTRKWIAERADLIGAVRLPNTAFKENAGTEVVTDIIVLRKRGKDEPSNGVDWVETGLETLTNTKTGEESQHNVNNFFITNPKHILGEATASGSMYKANEYTVESWNHAIGPLLNGWVEQYIPENIYQPISRTDVMTSANYSVPDGVKVGSFFINEKGDVLQRGEDELGSKTAQSWLSPNNKAMERMKGMIALRDTLRDQMRLEKSLDADTKQIEANRKKLNELYDQFQKNYGYLNNQTNRRIFLDDTESALVQALEFDYDRGVSKLVAEREEIEQRPESAIKADIFARRVLFPPANNIKVHNANDALLASLNYKGKVDLDYMAGLYDKPVDEIVSELGDAVYNDPIRGVVMADEYLSGDVKTKLEEAQAIAKNDPEFKRNVDALKKVIPKDKLPSEIHATLGANFIPTQIYDQFAQEVTGMKFAFRYLKATGQWIAMIDGNADPALNVGKWGIEKMPATEILTRTMAGQGVVVTRTVKMADGSTRTEVLEKETEAAREKQAALKVEWQRWLWADPDRAESIAAIYNDKMNRIVNRKFDGSHLTFPGMNPVMALLPHQKNAVWRMLQDRQVLLDHVVGAGKTFEIVTAFMEMRRLGIARKPFIAVPNHLTLQWRSEFNRLYPGSNILAATPDDFSKGNREKFFSKIITGDWDAVIVGHSSLKKIALPPETEKAVLEEQIHEISSAIEEIKRDRGDRNIIRDMENIRTRLQNRMKQRIQNLGERDNVVTFDELGADAFAVDELHEFKNLFYNTTMQRVPGMGNPKGSDKAFDLFVKLQWMFNTFGNDNAAAIGATGTPVSNSLVEMFNMQRLLQYPTLKANDLHIFDAWAKQFGSVESVYEVSPSGTGFRQSNRFSKFKNLPALMALYNSFADTVTLDDLKAQEIARGKTFPVPKIVGGRPQNIVAKRSEQVADFMGTPELEMVGSQPVFQFDPLNGDTFAIVPQDNGSVSFSIFDEDGGVKTAGISATEDEARLAIVEYALTPKIFVDEKSILGQFNNLKKLNKETKGKINALSLTGQANKAGLDYRLIDPTAPDFKDSKINKAVASTIENYQKWNKDKGTQLIFCDMSIPLSARSGFANKERRVYVRNDGNLVHKKGTLHTIEGHEDIPFFVVKEGSSKDKTLFAVYDAVSGQRIKGGMPSKAMAIEQAAQLIKNEGSRQTWIDAIEQAGEIEQEAIDEYNNEHEIDAEATESITRDDIAGSSGATQFSVYDDIKAKLVKQGIPEREIAFIHDYNTPSAKEKLFKSVNSGAVRVLLGSTQKMGAGTNVQQRLVALHHIDAPWKPSDLEQREGRIVRRGNKLYERDPENFEVAIYRYATEQTYDTRRWQILEHKARGIEQLRNYDGSLNEIDDIEGEAANAADMKAAASGDPLILEETQLRNEVRRLETLQSAHVDEKQMLRGRIRQNQRYINETAPGLLNEYQSLIDTANKHPVPANKDSFVGIKINGRTYNDRENAVKAIESQLKNAFAGQREVVFNYRGIPFSLENIAGLVYINSPTERMTTFDASKDKLPSPSGMLTRLANYIGRLNDHIIDIENQVEVAKKQIESMSQQLEQPFTQAQDLINAREAHKRVQRRLIAKGPDIPLHQKPILEKALITQREEIEKLGLGDALKEFEGNNQLKNWSKDKLKPDNERKGASPFNTIFGALSRDSATRQVFSIFQHLKLTATQDTTTAHSIQVTDSSGVGTFTVQVVSSFDGLPTEIQEAATYQDEDGNTQNYIVSGVWHGDTLYLVADGIEGNSAKQVTTFEAYQETILHEIIGHFGVQRIFGKEYKAKFQQLYNALGGLEGIRKIAAENGVDMQQFENAYIEPYTQGAADGIYESSDVQQALVGELFAFVAQNAEKKPFIRQKLKEIFGYIRQWLRDRGFMRLAQYNDADILMFIAEARKAVVDRRYFGKFKDQTISTNSSDKLFSRGQSATRTNTTVKQVRDKLVSRFGESTISKLEKDGKLNILDTYDEAGIEGFYQNGKATLIADALTDDTIVPTFLHELGGHGGFQNLMNQDQYRALMNQFNELVKRGNAIAIEAKLLAERENNSGTQQLEMLPYLLTLSSRMQMDNVIHKGAIRSLVNKVISAVKAWAFDRLGINLNLNPDDMVALAERMIHANVRINNSHSDDTLFSKNFDYNQIINRINAGIKNTTVKDLKNLSGYKFTDWLGMGLSTLGRRQLTEIYSKLLPQLNKYNDLAAQMDAEKNDAGAEADQIVRDWAKLVDHNELAELMHDATLAKIDPAKPYVNGDSVSKYKQLRDAYRSLSPEAQSMYEQARDAYKKHYAKVQQAIKERILRSELSSQKKADLLKQMDSQFYGYTKGVYFPLARFGKYVVIMRDSNGVAVESVSRAETMAEAQALRSELMQKYPHFKVDRVILDKEFNASRDAVGRGFMTSLFAEVDNLGLTTAEQAEFEDTLSQLYLSSLPDLSWAKHGIHRKGTAGFSQDARRAFAQNMFHGAGYLAKLRYSDQLAEQLDQMQKYTNEQVKTNQDFDQPTAQRVIDEMNKRHDLLMNPKSHPLSSALTSLGFIYYLGLSPASAMVNLMQTPLVAYPVLGSKWGYDKAGKALIKASEQAIKGKNDISKSLSVDEKKAYDRAVNGGVIDVTQAHDLAGIAQGEDSGIMWKTRPVMRWASFLFHQAERFNREVTFVAAYRLARENGATHDQAYEQATDATYKGHFDYSSGNRPRFMQGNVAKVMLLFKQFGQNMVYLLARQAHQAIKAENPKDRAQARRLLAGVLTTHALAAGVLGLPMVTTLLAAASMIGGDDDEPWDAEVALRNLIADIFGPDISNLIMKGASRGTPWDISGRVGLNNLILPDLQEGLEGQRLSESAMAAALGPVASIGTNVLKGAQEISEGQFGRGIETMLPTFLRSPLKALRYADEGVQDKTGITIQDEVGTLGLIGQAMGFSPADVRTSMEGKSAIYQLNKKLDIRRAQLMAQWSRAKLLDDTDRMDEVWEEIQQFNEKNPSRRINRINLNQSYKNRKNRINKAEDGIYLSKNRQDAREAGRFAFGE